MTIIDDLRAAQRAHADAVAARTQLEKLRSDFASKANALTSQLATLGPQAAEAEIAVALGERTAEERDEILSQVATTTTEHSRAVSGRDAADARLAKAKQAEDHARAAVRKIERTVATCVATFYRDRVRVAWREFLLLQRTWRDASHAAEGDWEGFAGYRHGSQGTPESLDEIAHAMGIDPQTFKPRAPHVRMTTDELVQRFEALASSH